MEETGYRIRDNKTKNKENVRYEDYGNIGQKAIKKNCTERSTENQHKWNLSKGQHKIFKGQQNYDMPGETGLGRDGNRI